jgi:hypothetical protein
MASTARSEPLAKEEKAYAILLITPATSTAELFRPLIQELQRLDNKNLVLVE